MGMARHAPMDTYQRKHYIAETAITRLREQLAYYEKEAKLQKKPIHGILAEWAYLDDDALINQLDLGVIDGIARNQFKSFKDAQGDCRAVDISDEFSSDTFPVPLYAIVKPYFDHGKLTKGKFIITTVMSHERFHELHSTGKFGIPDPAAKATFGDVVGEKIRGITASKSAPVVEAKPTVKPTVPVPVQSMSAETQVSETRMLVWQENGQTHTAQYALSEIQRQVFSLLGRGVDPKKIELWRPEKLKLQFELG